MSYFKHFPNILYQSPLSHKDSSGDFSVLEILNPSNKKEDINGKLIRFMN